ncbi:hypothetical protein [Teichococcus aestuarii]|uniref:hypothetical protein n=1 Tax=Teichococcus aestuarii TaxID=568898 RepID=UPI003619128E
MRRLVLSAFLAAPLALAALSGAAHAQQGGAQQPLRTAVDGTFAPTPSPSSMAACRASTSICSPRWRAAWAAPSPSTAPVSPA